MTEAAESVPAGRVVVMGVSGCGKSTVGEALAARLRWRYLEGDQLHPPENVARMAAGTPLTDADRAGWLAKIAAELSAAAARGEGLVVTCSALKRSYRDVLRAGDPALRFVFLHGPRELLEARLRERRGHYMPPSLLQSQLQTLEPPGDDEGALPLSIATESEQLVASAFHWIANHPGPP
jgi:gluconokinase